MELRSIVLTYVGGVSVVGALLNLVVMLLVLRLSRRVTLNFGHKLVLLVAGSDLVGGSIVLIRLLLWHSNRCGLVGYVLDLLIHGFYLQSNLLLGLLGIDRYLTAMGFPGVNWKVILGLVSLEATLAGVGMWYESFVSPLCGQVSGMGARGMFAALVLSSGLLTWSYLRIIAIRRESRKRVRDAISPMESFIEFSSEDAKGGIRRLYWKASLMVLAYLLFTLPVLIGLGCMSLTQLPREWYLGYTCCLISLQLFNPAMVLVLHSRIQNELLHYFLPNPPPLLCK